ncbi:hypothetical protein SteCoe_1441 [Stentor coeruleus]|uniref:Protein kinase domain-containing protein n=1 Tax=Stentor coeruleus TaxID=5963 RepID=A0A1R2D1S6_9CILI|nr:hypothetical protein SteCoe_1441 [Stentor coeruleus]
MRSKQKPVHNISTASANVRVGEINTSLQRMSLSDKTGSHTYTSDKVVGNGTFGVVYQATIAETGEKVAIKKVFQDKRYKNREYEIMKELIHPNVVGLRHAFYTPGEKPDEVFLNLVMEYFPDTLYRVVKNYGRMRQPIPLIIAKLYSYQIIRSLGYIHAMGVCHRDIKPQNLLVDPATHRLVLCDFGSAKRLVRGEPNVAYICSRYYRAPELIFGATDYTTLIDIWSAGCVIAEMFIFQPLFPGESAVDQLVEIIKILGTPTREQIFEMNPNYHEGRFPDIRQTPWNRVFKNKAPPEAIDLLASMLVYSPTKRVTAYQALQHPFFDELRVQGTRLPNGDPLPPLFNWSEIEMKTHPELIRSLTPSWFSN